MIAHMCVYYNPQERSVIRLLSDLFRVALSLNILFKEGATTKYNILFLMKWYFFVYTGQFVRQIGGEGISNYPIGVGINSVGEVLIADNHNNFNLTVFTQVRALILTDRHTPSVVWNIFVEIYENQYETMIGMCVLLIHGMHIWPDITGYCSQLTNHFLYYLNKNVLHIEDCQT